MHYGLKKTVIITALMATTILISGCQSNHSSNQTKLAITPESKMEKPMDKLPESPYWFPKSLLKWQFAKDPTAKYNVSSVPLAKRVAKAKLPLANKTQSKDMKVVALSIMNSSTSGNAPRGINTFDVNTFSYWQYIDKLVYWGGSAGEGIIVPPSADVIDAAHKNGVPVLGTIFFPQTVSGGKIAWLNTFLKQDKNGKFPIVDKLIAVEKAYGFDGWFINQETDTAVTSFDDAAAGKAAKTTKTGLTKKHATLMRQLIQQFRSEANGKAEIMWYDSMTKDGKMDWQNALTKENKDFLVDAKMKPVANSMFLNFWWNTKELADKNLLKSSSVEAKKSDINPANLYAGIDVQENGSSTPVRWNLFADKQNRPYTSLGLYCPSWTYFSSSDADEFQTKENSFWVNAQGDPRLSKPVQDNSWPGISTYAVEKTAITKLPFVTNFSLGNGYNYFINGKKVSNMDWNNRSMQDVMPTYRWEFDQGSGNNLQASIDYADAYNAGNSIKLQGNMKKNQATKMKLYAMQMPIVKGATLTTTAKASVPTKLDIVVKLANGQQQVLKGNKKVGRHWTTVSYSLTKIAQATVASISYQVTATKDASDFMMNLGQLAFRTKAQKASDAPTGVKLEKPVFDEDESNYAGVRLYWDKDKTEKVDHYEIYRVNDNQTRSFLGATSANTHYLNGLERNGKTNKTHFEIVAVNLWGKRSSASKAVTLNWPDNSIPKANFTASRTLIAPGQEVTFTNTSSANTTSVKWTFEGANISTSTKNKPSVTYAKEGTYSVKMMAKNKSGQTPVTMKHLIRVTKDATGPLALLSKGQKATASSFTNDSEAPGLTVDGKLDTKWCATGNPPHTLTIDLGANKLVSAVRLAHAEAGGENPDMNTKAWTLKTSINGKKFESVARISNNTAAKTITTFAPVKARYVQLVVDKPTQASDTAVRIYEMNVYGLK